MKFGSICSGIEAASVAWNSLGWEASWLAEVDAAASAVLAHHYGATAPQFPLPGSESKLKRVQWGDSIINWGDMTRIPDLVRSGAAEAPDVLCGGTPCQSYSLAGRRQGLSDQRGQLTLKFVELADAIDEQRAARGEQPCVVFWENVPGVLSSKDNAFGCFLADLAGEVVPLEPAGRKWTNAGVVLGPKRAVAWRVLDAQHFGLAQRRQRVFVVASSREGFDPAAVLFEFDGVRRDSAPSREAWQEAAGTLASRTDGGGFPGTDEACSGYVQPVGRSDVKWPAEIAPTLNAHFGEKQGLENQHINGGCGLFVPAPVVMSSGQGGAEISENRYPTLTCNHEAPFAAIPILEAGARTGVSTTDVRAGMGIGTSGDPMFTLQASKQHAIAYSVALRGRNNGQENAVCVTGDVTHTLTGEGFDASEDGTGRGQPIVPVALVQNTRDELRLMGGDGQIVGALAAQTGMKQQCYIAETTMAVRRLMPVECERLQGFPDGYTLVPIGGKPAADGPRYKQLGNSWAVPCVRWIGERIAAHVAELDAREVDPAPIQWLVRSALGVAA